MGRLRGNHEGWEGMRKVERERKRNKGELRKGSRRGRGR